MKKTLSILSFSALTLFSCGGGAKQNQTTLNLVDEKKDLIFKKDVSIFDKITAEKTFCRTISSGL